MIYKLGLKLLYKTKKYNFKYNLWNYKAVTELFVQCIIKISKDGFSLF